MKHILLKLLAFSCYLVSFLMIIYYLFLEFSIFSVTSPSSRLKIIFLIIILMYVGAVLLIKCHKDRFFRIGKFNLVIWFVLYIIMLLNLTLFDKYFGREGMVLYLNSGIDITDVTNRAFNIIPFNTVNNYFLALKNGNLTNMTFIYNIFGNLIAFMPFALFLPRIFKSVDKWYKYFIIVSILIVVIEISQYVMMSGSFDIDDYILNIIGSMLMYFIINSRILKNAIDKFLYLKY